MENRDKSFIILGGIGISIIFALLFIPSFAYDNTYFISNITANMTTFGTLNNLTDVVIVNVDTGDILTYNGTFWVNAGNSTVIALDDLTDVIIVSPVANQFLFYNGTDWINGAITKTQLPSSIAYEDEANIFTENQRIENNDVRLLDLRNTNANKDWRINEGATFNELYLSIFDGATNPRIISFNQDGSVTMEDYLLFQDDEGIKTASGDVMFTFDDTGNVISANNRDVFLGSGKINTDSYYILECSLGGSVRICIQQDAGNNTGRLAILPSGTSVNANIALGTNSNPATDQSLLLFSSGTGGHFIDSAITGAGVERALTFRMGTDNIITLNTDNTISVNDRDINDIDDLTLNHNLILDSGGAILAGEATILSDTDNMVFNVPTGKVYALFIDGSEIITISNSDINFRNREVVGLALPNNDGIDNENADGASGYWILRRNGNGGIVAPADGTNKRVIEFYTADSTTAGIGDITRKLFIDDAIEYKFYSKAGDPSGSDIDSGFCSTWKNTTSGVVKYWCNDGGTYKGIALA